MTLNEKAIEYNSNLTSDAREYLNDRGITDEIIAQYQLGYDPSNSGWITIPIRNADKEVLFFKKKKHPFNKEEDPCKFLYEPSGNKATLFNLEIIKDTKFVIICEGEMDALLLTAHGIPAVSNTSGSSCFNLDWLKYLSHLEKIIVCYDIDNPGLMGRLKVTDILYNELDRTEIRTFILPKEVGEDGDITDYIIKLGRNPQDIMTKTEKYYPEGLITAKDFCAGQLLRPQPKWLIDQFLPYQGITVIAGREKSGKTMIAHQMAKCLSDGSPLFGKYPISTKSRVLIVDKENNDNDRKERLEFVGSDKSEDILWYEMSNFKIDPSKDESIEMDKLIKVVLRENIKVVIFDLLILIHTGNEDNASDMSRVFSEIKRLNKLDVSVIVLHHMNKSNEGRGSTAIAGEANMVFNITSTVNSKDEYTTYINILCKCARSIRSGWHVKTLFDTRNLSNCFTLLDKEAEELANEALQKDVILNELQKVGGSIKRQQLIVLIKANMSDEIMDKRCYELELEGKIKTFKNPRDNNSKTFQLI